MFLHTFKDFAMKCLYSMVVGLLTLMQIGFVTLSATAIVPSRVIAADKIVRTQVFGFGKTHREAYVNARRAADKICGPNSPTTTVWRQIDIEEYYDINGNYGACMMFIEYVKK